MTHTFEQDKYQTLDLSNQGIVDIKFPYYVGHLDISGNRDIQLIDLIRDRDVTRVGESITMSGYQIPYIPMFDAGVTRDKYGHENTFTLDLTTAEGKEAFEHILDLVDIKNNQKLISLEDINDSLSIDYLVAKGMSAKKVGISAYADLIMADFDGVNADFFSASDFIYHMVQSKKINISHNHSLSKGDYVTAKRLDKQGFKLCEYSDKELTMAIGKAFVHDHALGESKKSVYLPNELYDRNRLEINIKGDIIECDETGFSIKTPKIVEIPYEGANNLLKKGQFVEVNMVQHQGEFQDIKIGKVLERQPLG